MKMYPRKKLPRLPRAGEAKNSWLTGTAAWNYVAVSQHILGIRPDFKGLKVEPCLAKEITDCKIVRKFRGTIFNITIENKNTGKMTVTCDNGNVNDNVVTPTGEICNVKVEM